MATIVTRAGKGSPLTNNEVDANFTNLNSDKVETSAISTFGGTLIDDADAAEARTTLGLGSAATTASTDYATAAQGALADSALQSADNLSDLADAATARTNLGLGSAATSATTDFVAQTSATGSAEIPAGTDAQRDGAPSAGYLRFNTDSDTFEGYDGTAWGTIGGSVDLSAVDQDIVPATDNTYDLGATGFEWKDLYVDGTANIDSLVADTADINGGTVDGTVIGGGTPAAISGTTITATGDVDIADKIAHTGDTDTAIRFPAADTVTVETGGSERARIDSSGNLLVGTTSSSARLHVSSSSTFDSFGTLYVANTNTTAGACVAAFSTATNSTATSNVLIKFAIDNYNSASGQINANGASQAAFGTFSDSRLKENISDLSPQLDSIMALRPVEFDYIASEGGGHQTGFIAQEMQQVYPDSVGERSTDGMLTVTGWGKTEARLVKALQEAVARIEELEARVAALEA